MTQSRQPAGAPSGGQFAATSRTEAAVTLVAGAVGHEWRDQPVRIEGREFVLGDVYGGRLFHGSPHLLDDGDVLAPGRADANFAQSDTASVSITSGADIAHHWGQEAAAGGAFYVYEVEPDAEVSVWRAMLANYGRNVRLQEGRVTAARVVRRIPLDAARGYETSLMRRVDPLTDPPAAED